MGFYVHIHVAFACDSNDEVANLAKKHLEIFKKQEENEVERENVYGS